MRGRLPLAGATGVLELARRTTALRLSLAVALSALLGGSIWLAAGSGSVARATPIRPGVPTVLVLDVSASIRPRVYRQVDDVLRGVVAGGGEAGLVVFSDVAYELLPVGTPVAELRSPERFYRALDPVPRGARTVALGRARFLRAPWRPSFTQGTRISTGLATALDVLRREASGRGRVVLVSDLGDEIGDLTALGRQVDRLAARGVALDVVALSPQPEDARLFRSLLAGRRGTVAEAAEPGASAAPAPRDRLPTWLVLAGAGLLLLLAVNEAFCAPLVLRTGEEAR